MRVDHRRGSADEYAHVSRHGPRSSARDRTILAVKERGRRRWKKTSGHGQARVENAVFRVHVDHRRQPSSVQSRRDGGLRSTLAVHDILNQMTVLGANVVPHRSSGLETVDPGVGVRFMQPTSARRMWGTDMTATVTIAEGPAFVFVAVDHCTAECIGLHAAKRGTRFEALEPIRQGIRERFGGIGDGVARGLRLRHDHGSNYLADDFQQEVAFFGIQSSPSFVREPEGNGVRSASSAR